ncbi:Predicted carboxypeptidase [Aquiflexum balticum DSM 16537]|uniref:Predicted carboxypeptidase n=1 Tax=Aquiflexum balticum DSM 16537 TaxID=758820 RepID=A0A1W2H1A7_9BACT|nr:M14 family zinc carboxypeptidase [Aquiflexum balticum]SMD42402.1 Predicted carboxypeptidase [Aquiflexum balticum DSM 16537]
MKKISWLVLVILFTQGVSAQEKYVTLFEQSEGRETPIYSEVIQYFETLANDFKEVKMVEMGITDSGFPLHVLLFDRQQIFDPKKWHEANRLVLFINNGIHPGEPDGIDASMMFLRDILLNKIEIPENLAMAIVPVYNIGGHLNRGSFSRVNQNGPEEFGFRGNARNYDLNRDFIKADTKNARSFQQIFNWLRPQVFIDTHVSNGADYQHVMTLISTQHNRLGGKLGEYLENELNPQLYAKMKDRDFPMVPYVNAWGGKPEDGWSQFKDSGRYSSGYAALHSTLSFMPETHMLKPYHLRVASTYALFETFMEILEKDGAKIVASAKADRSNQISQSEFSMNHTIDKSSYKTIEFLGFESGQKPSEISGLPRLYYDRSKPFTKEVRFYDTYVDGLIISKPDAYLIPQGWFNVIENLYRNGVHLVELKNDSAISVTVYEIKEFQTAQRPFEGHYLHSNTKVEKIQTKINFRKGDFMVPMNQEVNRYIMEVLEPESEDSFFNWNFFDTILQSKEGYSAYVFEDLVAEFLNRNPDLRNKLEAAKSENEELAKSGSAQLRWVYEHSPWKEKEHNRYPVYRIEKMD